ncbi:SMC-Scp complex subunit ScpB [Candidatus Pacearchaeota archaeon CG10_big_fil_rev_8_21_14_0_10_31_24]|nr:MAG: SMC-Scp complex subunit ScpB [Candidatus Pacearchaeota archaeon CG10_big_fil_rev_8_21_14_0_10_31_24]
MSLKNQVEAILFAVGKGIEIDELAKLCNSNFGDVRNALNSLEEDYKKRDCALMITGGEKIWKLNVREKYLNLVRNIIVETELSVPSMETLALISYKQPALQSDIIKHRSVGAYDHIKELVDQGFIIRKKSGRSYELRLTPRFFEYFDVDDQRIKDMFENFKKEEESIKQSEEEVAELEEERKKDSKQAKLIEEEKVKESEKTYVEQMAEIDEELEGV